MSTLGWIHIPAAVAALAAGAAIVFRAKGTLSHRRLGWVYAACMQASPLRGAC